MPQILSVHDGPEARQPSSHHPKDLCAVVAENADRQSARKLEPRQVVTICNHRQLFLCRESKGEITRETICIPFDRLVQGLRRNCIERGKIGIDDDLTVTDRENHGSERFELLHNRILIGPADHRRIFTAGSLANLLNESYADGRMANSITAAIRPSATEAMKSRFSVSRVSVGRW